MWINEALQWAAISFMAVFVVGLTRQVGLFLTTTRKGRAELTGPPTGGDIPRSLLRDGERARLQELIEERGVDWAGILVTAQSCETCEVLLRETQETGIPDGAPTMVICGDGDDEYVDRLRGFADLVVIDAARLRRNGIRVTPFTLILDRRLKVARKAISGLFAIEVERWRDSLQEDDDGAPDPAAHLAVHVSNPESRDDVDAFLAGVRIDDRVPPVVSYHPPFAPGDAREFEQRDDLLFTRGSGAATEWLGVCRLPPGRRPERFPRFPDLTVETAGSGVGLMARWTAPPEERERVRGEIEAVAQSMRRRS